MLGYPAYMTVKIPDIKSKVTPRDIRYWLNLKYGDIPAVARVYRRSPSTIYNHIHGGCHNAFLAKAIARDLELSLVDCWADIYPGRYAK